MDWIKFEERKPEKEQFIWVIAEGYESPMIMQYILRNSPDECEVFLRIDTVPSYIDGKWEALCYYLDDEYTVTHWMPLPDLPKTKEQECKEIMDDLVAKLLSKYSN